MDKDSKQSLFQVYLRLRPPQQGQTTKEPQEPWLIVERPTPDSEASDRSASAPSHITLQPPNDSRKRAVERFGFTKVFEEDASQLDIFEQAGTVQILNSVLKDGRDGLVATLGVTGSGKSHTILGSRTQRGLTQMSLDTIFRSIGPNIRRVDNLELPTDHDFLASLQAADSSEANLSSASSFLESIYGEAERGRFSRAQTPMTAGGFSRAQTPMTVRNPIFKIPGSFPSTTPPPGIAGSCITYPRLSDVVIGTQPLSDVTPTVRLIPPSPKSRSKEAFIPSKLPFWNRTSFVHKEIDAKSKCAKESHTTTASRRPLLHRPSALPLIPDVSHHATQLEQNADYAVIVSMYEVYNDRIFDLLALSTLPNGAQPMTRQGTMLQKDLRRRPLLFKSTEMSPDRKIVAGLRKVVCGSYEEAMMVLETGLTERRVAGTGSNSVSSRSHGFFCIEVRKNLSPRRYDGGAWIGGALSIVDLAGSERARSSKTTGSTLAEAGKINESLMYLGQCLQLQSDYHPDKPAIVPYRQCKLTELLFSNSFPTSTIHSSYRTPQKATMIVTADPQGDFNATSQILRYSALAREVTVPRIPSVTSQILSSSAANKPHQTASGRTSPYSEELELAIHEIARLSEDNDVLCIRLAEEEINVTEMTIALRAAEDKALAIEAEVREECWAETEARIEEERTRYRTAWEQEKAMGEEFLDGKIGILERGGIAVAEDETATSSNEWMDEVMRENETLRTRNEALEREVQGRSPTKKSKHSPTKRTVSRPLGIMTASPNTNTATSFHDISLLSTRDSSKNWSSIASPTGSEFNTTPLKLALEDLRLGGENLAVGKTPATAKKQRKLTTRKWDLGGEDELFG